MIPPVELKDAFTARPPDAHKRSVGTVVVAGGSDRFPHAPAVAALGARAAGAGLVHLAAPDASRHAAAALVPEATFTRLEPSCELPAADVCVIGMGLGLDCESENFAERVLMGGQGRFVVDADALTIVARLRAAGRWNPDSASRFVFTPHEGEAARLLGCDAADVSADRTGAARSIAATYGVCAVLKGRGTVVAGPGARDVYVNGTGNPVLACGGTGDLLAGVVGARWAYLRSPAHLAAASAVWLHGAAADAIAENMEDPSLRNIASRIGSLRILLDR